MDKITFPYPGVTEAPQVAKLLGLYRQRQDGQWMQRVKIPGGALTSEQWIAFGRMAESLTPGTPLHLTTRQDIELHNLGDEQVPLAQRMIAEIGLTGLGAGGDSLRNVTVCPCSGIFRGAVDLHELVRQIRGTLEAEEGILSLPRKFKISLSCSSACGQPWINDLGLVVRRREGRYGFRVIGAGSLGRKPAAGIVLFDWLPAADVLPLVTAALRIFATHGDREHRNRARFRHVRERFGNEKFTAMLSAEFEKVRAERTWTEASLAKPGDEFNSRLPLTFPNGDVSAMAAEALGRLAGSDDIRVRIANHHCVVVFGRDDGQLHQAVAAFDSLAQAAKPQPAIVACPGTRWCKCALVDTNRIADRIGAELGGRLSPDMTVCISGCPNDCAHSAVAAIGLTGASARSGGRRQEVCNLSAGGGMGRTDELAKPVAQGLCSEDVIEAMAKLLAGPG